VLRAERAFRLRRLEINIDVSGPQSINQGPLPVTLANAPEITNVLTMICRWEAENAQLLAPGASNLGQQAGAGCP
jgi:hypothetical protein